MHVAILNPSSQTVIWKKIYKRRLFQNVVEIYIAYVAHFFAYKNYDENILFFYERKKNNV